MHIQIDPQPIVEAFATLINWGITFAWTIIDTIVFIELENPLGEVAIFVTVVAALLGGVYGLSQLQDNR